MKLTAILLILGYIQVNAKGFSQTLTLHLKDASLEQAFKEIEKQTGYSFVYGKEQLARSKPVNLTVSDANLETVLDIVFRDQGLTYIISQKFIAVRQETILMPQTMGFNEEPPPIKITGKITDEHGKPLQGASVQIKGTSSGTSSDVNGEFQIDVPDNSSKILVFSFIGMEQQEVNVTGKTKINVALRTKAMRQQEIVLVGYGEASRANLTTAQATITSEQIDKTINTTLEQAIQGRASGVYVTQNSGQPGGGVSISIRGVNSITGSNEPLYVIDGVQIPGEAVAGGPQSSSNPLAGLNPSDVEDIQILQGPSATAIYGSRATNGVVLITTKKGKAGVPKLNYAFQYNIQETPRHLPVMDLQQYAQMLIDFQQVMGGPVHGRFQDPSLLGKGTDWQKELFGRAPMSKHQLSMSGGNDRTTYYLSGEYLDQEGIAAGSGFNRYGFRLNLENKPTSWLTLGTNLNFNETKENLTTSDNGIISNALRLTPQIPVKNFDGSWGGGDDINGGSEFAPVNPIAIAALTTNRNLRREFLGGINGAIKLAKGLTFKTSFNTRINYRVSTLYAPAYEIGWSINPISTYTDGTGVNTYWSWNQLLHYNRKIGKHQFDMMVSHEAQASEYKLVSSSRQGYLTNDILDLAAGDPTTAGNTGGSGQWAMESWLGRLNYNYGDRYLLSATLRRDGSANFGDDNKWGNFPSVSAAWRVSKEAFFKIPFISELKLRYEVGLTGNQGGGGGIYSPLYAAATPFGGTGFMPSRYGNPALKWEQTRTNNWGLNVGLLDNRVEVVFDYYIKNTDNLLMRNPLPWYMGTIGAGAVGPPTVNIGAIQTEGWGLAINTLNIVRKKFKWASNFNVSGFKTIVKKLYSDDAFVNRVSWWMANWTQQSAVGSVPWMFRGYIEDGLFQSLDEINNSAIPVDNTGTRLPVDQQTGIWVGDVKYKDISGPGGKPDGIIDVYDETNIGNPWPKLFGGFSNTVTYKNFDLSVLITGVWGNEVYNYLAMVNSNPQNLTLGRNLLTHAFEFARPVYDDGGNLVLENPDTDVPRVSNGPNGNSTRFTTRWVEDGSFVRLKNVALSYSLSADLLSKQNFVKGVKITLSAQNIVTLTRYSGFDPEVGSYVGQNVGSDIQPIGLDFGKYPLTPIYSFALNVNF